jgi:hypothetical protein
LGVEVLGNECIRQKSAAEGIKGKQSASFVTAFLVAGEM